MQRVYNYDPLTKTISVNKEEAETVKYIFKRYLEGYGCRVICHELENKVIPNPSGGKRWMETTITGILLNEKYVGDLLQVKSFTLDPISKKRLDNYGESDMYYIQDHHETTISREDFEAAQEILRQRGRSRKPSDDKKYHQLSNKYSFSSKLECGFYVTTLSRRACNSKTSYKKVI